MNHVQNEAAVFRQVAFPVSAFDHLKDYQRTYQERHGIRLNNNQCLALILAEHREASRKGLLDGLGYAVASSEAGGAA